MKNLFPNSILQIIFLIFSAYVLSMPAYILLGKFQLPLEEFITIYFLILTSLTIILFFIISRIKKQPINYQFGLKNIPYLGLFIILIVSFQIGLNVPLSKLINSILHPENLSNKTQNVTYFMIGALILAPFLEELIFRGIILRGLLSRYSPLTSIVITSILFGLIHPEPTQIVGAISFGLFLSWVFYFTNNIGVCILLHFTANLTVLTFGYYTFEAPLNLVYFLSIIFLILFILIGMKVLKIIRKSIV